MTLPSAGPISAAQIVAELGKSLPYKFPTAETRWLADVGSSAPITIPTQFHGKTSVKVVATAAQATSGTSHTFSGVNFGAAFSGRVLVACIGLEGPNDGVLDQISCTIGGVSANGQDNGNLASGGPACGAGVWASSVPSGTSGNVFVDWSGVAASAAGLVLLSVASISTTPHDTDGGTIPPGPATSTTATLNIPANGVLIVSAAHRNLNNGTMSGVTERQAVNFGSARLEVGFNNRLGSQAGRNVTVSWSGSVVMGLRASSYAQ